MKVCKKCGKQKWQAKCGKRYRCLPCEYKSRKERGKIKVNKDKARINWEKWAEKNKEKLTKLREKRKRKLKEERLIARKNKAEKNQICHCGRIKTLRIRKRGQSQGLIPLNYICSTCSAKRYASLHPQKYRENNLRCARRARAELKDYYVKRRLNISAKNKTVIPQILIEAKRAQLELVRLLKKTHEKTNKR